MEKKIHGSESRVTLVHFIAWHKHLQCTYETVNLARSVRAILVVIQGFICFNGTFDNSADALDI